MKKQITTTVATLSLFIALAAIGYAGLGTKLIADIPFDFTVNGKTLAAGKYEVSKGAAPSTLQIRNIETGNSAATIARDENGDGNGKAALKFHRYGNQYFLTNVTDGNKTLELPKSNNERKAARGGDNLANSEIKPEIVTVSAAAGQ